MCSGYRAALERRYESVQPCAHALEVGGGGEAGACQPECVAHPL
ncbi:hypothetical protein N136_01445, partial [Leifsonia aquatica ATCC 14665]